MIKWDTSAAVYLHKEPVDFRKAINGLAVIVSGAMSLSPFDKAIYVFCNKRRTQLKVLYWDDTGFALWQKRLEKDKFKWPRKHALDTVKIDNEQWQWLLRGFDISNFNPHKNIYFEEVA